MLKSINERYEEIEKWNNKEKDIPEEVLAFSKKILTFIPGERPYIYPNLNKGIRFEWKANNNNISIEFTDFIWVHIFNSISGEVEEFEFQCKDENFVANLITKILGDNL